MSNIHVPPRIHVLMSSQSDQAVVIRRGPSKQVAILGWNRKTNKLVLGQWLKGHIYHYRCDISPNGKYWIYFAMDTRSNTYTAVAPTPYLKAIDFYRKGDAWNGGGLFVSDKLYWLNDGGIEHKPERKSSVLQSTVTHTLYPSYHGECSDIYAMRLQRDGWQMGKWEKLGEYNELLPFTKRINDYWVLLKIFHASLERPVGKGVYYEEHKLVNVKSGEEVLCPDWEWADVDRDRIVWAEKGKLMAGRVHKDILSTCIELYDFNDMTFEERIAPY